MLLRLEHISKAFAGVQALNDVSLDFRKGEVHCIVGENGSGKSTLVKIVTGVYEPDAGQILINGQPYSKLNPSHAMKEGIQVIYQDLALFDHMTIAENIAINKIRQEQKPFVSWKEVRKIAAAQMEKIGVSMDMDMTIQETSIGNRQVSAICRALALDAKILFMDEPTTALTRQEVDRLLSIVEDLKNKGLSVVFISHKLDEVFQISDRITVFRDGLMVGSFLRDELNQEKLTYHMTGRNVKYPTYKRTNSTTVPFIKIDRLTKNGMYRDISLEVRPGDIVGFIGLLGSGRTELALSLFGLNKPDSGLIEFGSTAKTSVASPSEAKKMGAVLLPEDRLTQGLFLERDVNENISSSIIDSLSGRFGFFNCKKEQACAEEGVKKIRIKTPSIYTKIKNLSGGNQQKAVIEKLILTQPKLFIMDSPTVGIDVGSKSEIYEIIQDLAKEGIGIILISDEVEEIVCNCNKVIVFSKGNAAAVLNETELEQPGIGEQILALVSQDYVKEAGGGAA